MTVEHLVKRTIYVAKCECGEKYVLDANPPRERQCQCGKWVRAGVLRRRRSLRQVMRAARQ
jgi:hypothetical protein